MYILYSVDAKNPRLPNERVVHVIDTELPDRIFVAETTQGDRTVKRLVDSIDDFIGDQTKDLTKPMQLLGVDGDTFGARLIAEVVKKQPIYVTIKYATINKALRF